MPLIPALWEAKAGESPEAKNSRQAWATWQNTVCTKNTKKEKDSWVWWCMPVVSAAWEAEMGKPAEPRKSRLQ